MNTNTIFKIGLKLVGVFSIYGLILQLINSVSMMFISQSPIETHASLLSIIYPVGTFLYLLVFYLLVFKTDRIIKTLKLTDNMKTESITIEVNEGTVYKIAFIILGFFLIAEKLSPFIIAIFQYFSSGATMGELPKNMQKNLLVNGSILLIGLIFIVGSDRLSNYFTYRNQNHKNMEI